METDSQNEMMMIMVAIEALSQRVKVLERIVRPATNTVFKPAHRDNWADIKEGGEFQWSKL